jgi:beta-glucosidase
METTREHPWSNADLSPDERARLAEAAMNDDERFALVHGIMAVPFPGLAARSLPNAAVPGAGYVAGAPRLGIPSLRETDATLGVTNPRDIRAGDAATAFPAALAVGAAFNLALAERMGGVIGLEARARGFNVLLGGGINLVRDPRGGRNFEYVSEDPLLSGLVGAAWVRGAQSQGVICTIKHFSLNAQETCRHTLDARIGPAAHRESDLLAFQIAIERGAPGAVMGAYNAVNGEAACGNHELLVNVLKRDWNYPGWVMSDWGAVHDWRFALAGLDQQSGEQLDKQVWFDAPLREALTSGEFPRARLSDMVCRVLRSIFGAGVADWKHPPAIDASAHDEIALQVAREGCVLLRNERNLLPLENRTAIAVIGGRAQLGVICGAGSSQVKPQGGFALTIPIGGEGAMGRLRAESYHPGAPLKEIKRLAGNARVRFDPGQSHAAAAALAARSEVAIVFATRHEAEGFDNADLRLPYGQDELIAAVAKANSNTIVVLETGNPVAMPWISDVSAVLAAWFPGQGGARAIAEILFGETNPSGRLPITFPLPTRLQRPQLAGLGQNPFDPVTVTYDEGADVGYRWYARENAPVLFPFGHGLSYTSFSYENLKLAGGSTVTASFTVTNRGARSGIDIPQLYLLNAAGQKLQRLAGFAHVKLAPGQSTRVEIKAEPRVLAAFDGDANAWSILGGPHRFAIGASATDLRLDGEATLNARVFTDADARRDQQA